MASMKSLMMGAAILAGAAGFGATSAKAAQFGVYVGTRPAYAAPYPGPGYTWVEGYYNGGYWIPGRWAYARHFDRDDYYRGRHHHDRHDRHYDRDDRHHDHDWDHDWYRR